MRLIRLVPALAVGALLVSSVAPAHARPAQEAEGSQAGEEVSGTGTTTGSLTILGLRAGDLLSLDLLSDHGLANTDEAVGEPSALAEVAALAVESPAAGVSQNVPVVSVESTGEPQEESTEVQPVDNPAVSGTIVPMALSAVVGDDGAVSGLSAGVTDLDVLSGVLRVVSTELGLDSAARTTTADGLHGARVDAITALDLEALLAGLGIPLADLPVDTVLSLVDSLGLLPQLSAVLEEQGVPGLDLENLTVEDYLATIDGSEEDIALLEDLHESLTVDEATCDTTEPAIGLLGELTGADTSTLCDDVAQTLNDTAEQIEDLETQLGLLLSAPVDALSGQALLTLDGLEVGIVTQATDSLETSVADVTASLGGIEVAGLELGGLDLTDATDQVNATVDQIEGTLGGVLATIDPALGDIFQISALESSTSVAEAGEGIVASADFTGLRVSVLPDAAELLSVVEGLAEGESVGDQLSGLGLAVPEAPADIAAFNEALAGTPTSGLADDSAVYALSEGVTFEVASANQQSSYAGVAPAAPEEPQLPTTGSNDTLLLLLGAGAVTAALGTRRLLHRAG